VESLHLNLRSPQQQGGQPKDELQGGPTMRTNRLLSLAPLILAIPATLFAQLSVSIAVAPPELVAYSQPSPDNS
jgi:hypothetical protein